MSPGHEIMILILLYLRVYWLRSCCYIFYTVCIVETFKLDVVRYDYEKIFIASIVGKIKRENDYELDFANFFYYVTLLGHLKFKVNQRKSYDITPLHLTNILLFSFTELI